MKRPPPSIVNLSSESGFEWEAGKCTPPGGQASLPSPHRPRAATALAASDETRRSPTRTSRVGAVSTVWEGQEFKAQSKQRRGSPLERNAPPLSPFWINSLRATGLLR